MDQPPTGMHVSLHASEKHSLPPRDAYGDMCGIRGHVSRRELSAGPGRGWSENKGPQKTTTSKGGTKAGGGSPLVFAMGRWGGQDGRTGVEIHGKKKKEKWRRKE